MRVGRFEAVEQKFCLTSFDPEPLKVLTFGDGQLALGLTFIDLFWLKLLLIIWPLCEGGWELTEKAGSLR